MNLTLRILLIAVAGSVAQYFFPWWSALLVAGLVEAGFGTTGKYRFFSGFYGVCVPWLIMATWLHLSADPAFAERILKLFHMPPYGFVLIIITGLLGGLVGAAGSLTGGWIRASLTKDHVEG